MEINSKVGAGRFTLVRPLGRGGMGEVWLAQDERLGEQVALKFLPPEIRGDARSLDDLRRETARSHRLTHPNIVRIHDLNEAEGEPAFIAMEYVDGSTLTGLQMQQPDRVLSWEFLKPLVQQLCAALDYAHGENVIHRDLKPANIMADGKGRLKLADFGIAATVSDSVSRVSARHATSGTLLYMSPQQLAGKRPQIADDIYALGATLYELLTSKPPFYTGDVTHQVLHEAPEPLGERLAGLGIQNVVPGDVAALIMACLAKEPAQRPQSARAVAEWIGLEVVAKASLESLAGDVFSSAQAAEAARGTSDLAAAAPAARSGRKAIWAGSVVFILLALLAAGGWYWTTRESAGKRPSALAQTASLEPPGAPASLSARGSLPKPASELTAQPRAPFPLVGTWEFVSAKTADGKENQAFVEAFKDKWYIKMLTPTHYICVSIEPTTGKIANAHGGPCLLGNGQVTDWIQYGTARSWGPGAKVFHFKVRFEGDKFVQSFEDGNEETWRRAKAADVTTAAPRPGTEKAITLPLVGTWEFVSAKTADGKENQAYVKAFKDKRCIKMITPTHYICVTIDPTSGEITGAHGGPCLLGNGQFTEWPQYGTDPSWVQGAKVNHLKVRFEGDKFVQSFEDGNEETWRRAKAVEEPTTPSPPASAEPKVTLPPGAAQAPAPFEGKGWQAMFDGQTLAGWREIPFAGHGEVHCQTGAVVLSMGDPFTGITWTNDFPKMNYEVALDAMRLMGSDFFCGLTVPIRDTFCSLIVGGWGGSLIGVSRLDGMDAPDNETKKFASFESGRWYRIRLRVTEKKIEGWIDKEKLVDVAIGERKIALQPGDIELCKPFGVAAWQTSSALREIRYRRVSAAAGKGE